MKLLCSGTFLELGVKLSIRVKILIETYLYHLVYVYMYLDTVSANCFSNYKHIPISTLYTKATSSGGIRSHEP
jgi:hypothetical protein